MYVTRNTHAFSNKRSRYRCKPFFSTLMLLLVGTVIKGYQVNEICFLFDMKVGAPGQND